MNTLTIMLIAFAGISLSMAAVYFYIFARGQERFIQYWGLCWVCYSCSLLFLILGGSENNQVFFGLRKVFDMFNILFLLFGTYAFPNLRIPGYWIRFSLYLSIWALLAVLYHFDLMSLYLPTSMFQICVTSMLCFLILRHWRVPTAERSIAVVVFGLWGYGKAVISFVEAINLQHMTSFYLLEIIFSNVLNFMVFVIYLQRAQARLGAAEKQFKLIAENASDVIFFYRISPPAFTYITPSVEKILGYAPQEFYGDGRFYRQLVDTQDFENMDALFDYRTFERGQSENTKVMRMYLKNSQTIWGEISTTLICEDDTPIALEGVIRDITAMKGAEEQLLASKRSREVFLSYISHELKTPITSLLGYVTALRDETIVTEADRRKALDIIYKKTLTLERLIYDLFQLTKLETKQFSFDFMMISGQEFAAELMNKHYLDFSGAGLKLNLKINKAALAGVSLIVDPDRMEQVFSNILANAIRVSGKGAQIKITFDLDSKKEHLEFSVTDYGCGISKEDMPYIFDRFYRVQIGKGTAQEDTSGLGMTISKEIVESHKGTITVKSRLRRGTTFTVSLPLFLDKDL